MKKFELNLNKKVSGIKDITKALIENFNAANDDRYELLTFFEINANTLSIEFNDLGVIIRDFTKPHIVVSIPRVYIHSIDVYY